MIDFATYLILKLPFCRIWLCLICFFLAACTDTKQTSVTPGLIPTQQNLAGTTQFIQPLSKINLEHIATNQIVSYRNITPGISHIQYVLSQWGEPNVIRTHENYQSLHYFRDGFWEYVLIKNNTVQAVTTNVRELIFYANRPANLQDLSEQLQIPEVITYTFGLPTQVFLDYGLAVSGFQDNIQSYQLFVPTNFEEYRNLWGSYPLAYDPFPIMPSVDTVGIQPGTTTREQLASLLGNPDRIVLEDPNSPWWYALEPDTFGRLLISFNDDDTVKTMATDGGTKAIFLEEIINAFGSPNIVQLLPDEHGNKYGSLALVYMERGLRVATNCVTETCEIVNRDALVSQKWYFQPTSFENYQAFFPNSAFVNWRGFDD